MPAGHPWAELLKRVFRIDALVCDHCGRARRILAAIIEADAIRRILAHLDLPTDPPPIQLARPPPELDLDRKSVVQGKSVYRGCRRIIKKVHFEWEYLQR